MKASVNRKKNILMIQFNKVKYINFVVLTVSDEINTIIFLLLPTMRRMKGFSKLFATLVIAFSL